MKNIIIIVILFLVIFLIYILSTKVRNNKLESFFSNSNDCKCDISNSDTHDISNVSTSMTDEKGNIINLVNMKNMCQNIGYEVNSRDFKRKEENMFWGDCKQTCLNDKDCFGFQFKEKDLSGTNGVCTYYTANQIGGINSSKMIESDRYNSLSGYSSVFLRSSKPCISKKSGYLTSDLPSNKGNYSSYANQFQNDQNKYYNNIFENNLNSVLNRDSEYTCYKENEVTQICTSKKIFNFTLDEKNPTNLYIYSIDSWTYNSWNNLQIWYVDTNPNTGCFILNQFKALCKPFNITNLGSWNTVPIKMQVYNDNIYYSTVNQNIYKLSIGVFNDKKILDTSQASDYWDSGLGAFRLFKDKVYFINNRYGTQSSTAICYFIPGDPITIQPYEVSNHYQSNLIDFEIFTYNLNTMLIGLTKGGKLVAKSSPTSNWKTYDNHYISQIYIDSRENPDYLYGLNADRHIIRKRFKDIRIGNSKSLKIWEPVINESIYRFKIFDINGVRVVIYILQRDMSLNLKVLPYN